VGSECVGKERYQKYMKGRKKQLLNKHGVK